MGGLRSVAGAPRQSVLRTPAGVRAHVGGGASAPFPDVPVDANEIATLALGSLETTLGTMWGRKCRSEM